MSRERISYYNPVHATADRAYNEKRNADKRFYSRIAWLKLRALKLATDPLCEHCHKRGELTVAEHVHHVEEVRSRPDLALVMENLESLCESCHNAETARRQREDSRP